MTVRILILILLLILSTVISSQPEKQAQQILLDAYPLGFYMDDPLPEKTAFLTFDDGPSDFTDDILDVLRKENVKATFFISADWAPKSTRKNNSFKKFDLTLLEMIKDGHILGNHTVDHRELSALSPEKILKQLEDNQELLNKYLGKDAPLMTIMRPPHGSPWYWKKYFPVNTKIKVGKALKNKWIVAMWSKHLDSSDSMDWVKGEWYQDGKKINPNNWSFKQKMYRIYKRVISRANGQGVVILFHDTHPTTWRILKSIIQELKSEGYSFATMEDYVKWRWGKSSRELLGR